MGARSQFADRHCFLGRNQRDEVGRNFPYDLPLGQQRLSNAHPLGAELADFRNVLRAFSLKLGKSRFDLPMRGFQGCKERVRTGVVDARYEPLLANWI